MSMTVVVTSNVAARIRGFLASSMLEIGPGIYTMPDMTVSVRERVWRVCTEWFEELPAEEASILMTWSDKRLPAGQGIAVLGSPARTLVDYHGIILSKLST